MKPTMVAPFRYNTLPILDRGQMDGPASLQTRRNHRRLPALLMASLLASPLLFIGFIVLHDKHVQSAVAATHANPVEDGKLSAAVSKMTSLLPASLQREESEKLHAVADMATHATSRTEKARMQKKACVRRSGPAGSFIMVFMGHSGSSAVISELRGHSRVQVAFEPEAVDHGEKQHNGTAAHAYVREFFRDARAQGRIPGFKMRPQHILNDPDAWRAIAREFDTRIIWNYRVNIVKQAVGEYSYKKLGDHSVVEGLRSETEARRRCEKGVGCKFAIDDMDFFHFTLRDLVKADGVISSAAHLISAGRTPDEGRICVHEVPYEDYLYNRRETMSALYEFLGLESEETSPERFKATKDNLCEVVDNWDALCRNFYGCYAWRPMMYDKLNGCSCKEMGEETKYCRTS